MKCFQIAGHLFEKFLFKDPKTKIIFEYNVMIFMIVNLQIFFSVDNLPIQKNLSW